jgi:CRISPR-associated exonuclease Cas4
MAVTFTEDDLLPVSALQHLAFCERQWALIHLEQAWAENVLTAEGRLMHDRTHAEEIETRGDIRIVRGLRVHSMRLGLAGMMDVVEFARVDAKAADDGNRNTIRLPGIDGLWSPTPVEYKRGKPKPDICDEVQLCAQALCLEEMLHMLIPSGAIFYGRPRRRTEVAFDSALRRETEALAVRLHQLHSLAKTPPPVYSRKCPSCSLVDTCRPKVMRAKSTRRYVLSSLREMGLSSPGGYGDGEDRYDQAGGYR